MRRHSALYLVKFSISGTYCFWPSLTALETISQLRCPPSQKRTACVCVHGHFCNGVSVFCMRAPLRRFRPTLPRTPLSWMFSDLSAAPQESTTPEKPLPPARACAAQPPLLLYGTYPFEACSYIVAPRLADGGLARTFLTTLLQRIFIPTAHTRFCDADGRVTPLRPPPP